MSSPESCSARLLCMDPSTSRSHVPANSNRASQLVAVLHPSGRWNKSRQSQTIGLGPLNGRKAGQQSL